jgi:hypothetical protein
MADKKLERALYGPSTTEVALGALLGLIAGVLVAAVYLVFKPVQTVKELPKEPARGVVYFIPGSESNAKSRNWQAKHKQLVGSPTFTLDLVEDELNAWAGTLGAPAPAAKPGAAPGAPNQPQLDGIFNPGRPNFKITNGKLQIGAKCVLNWYGLTYETNVITTGTFDGGAFKVETLHLGSCPVHLIPGLAGPLASHLIGRVKVPDDLRAGWAKVDSATLEGATLKVVAQ